MNSHSLSRVRSPITARFDLPLSINFPYLGMHNDVHQSRTVLPKSPFINHISFVVLFNLDHLLYILNLKSRTLIPSNLKFSTPSNLLEGEISLSISFQRSGHRQRVRRLWNRSLLESRNWLLRRHWSPIGVLNQSLRSGRWEGRREGGHEKLWEEIGLTGVREEWTGKIWENIGGGYGSNWRWSQLRFWTCLSKLLPRPLDQGKYPNYMPWRRLLL
jgi:hypothetical protein